MDVVAVLRPVVGADSPSLHGKVYVPSQLQRVDPRLDRSSPGHRQWPGYGKRYARGRPQVRLTCGVLARRDRPPPLRLEWESASQHRQVVPAACLYVRLDDPEAPPVVRVTAPFDFTVIYGPAEVPLSATVDAESHHLQRIEFYQGATSLKALDREPYQFTWQNAPFGDYLIRAKAIEAGAIVSASPPVRLIVADDNEGKLPRPWARFNIGQPKRPATATVAADAGGTIALGRTGGELYAAADQCQFLFQPLHGDGEFVARLSDLHADNANARPAAGIMFRRSLGADGEVAAMLFSPKVGSLFLSRKEPATASANTAAAAAAPGFLRLVRQGENVRGFRSDDGNKWEFMGEVVLDMPDTILAGLVLATEMDGVAGAATFDHAAVTAKLITQEEAPFDTGLMLVDGTLLHGKYRGLAKDAVVLEMGGDGPRDVRSKIRIEADQVARIYFKPLKPEVERGIAPDQRGVILPGGDFFEGETSLRGEAVRVVSDAFGPRDFSRHTLVAAFVRPVVTSAARYQLSLKDGSLIRAARCPSTTTASSSISPP